MGEIETPSGDASDNNSKGASSLKVHEEEEEQSGEEEVSIVLRLHVIAKIALPYKMPYHICGSYSKNPRI